MTSDEKEFLYYRMILRYVTVMLFIIMASICYGCTLDAGNRIKEMELAEKGICKLNIGRGENVQPVFYRCPKM